MLRMWVVEGVEGQRRRVVPEQWPEGAGDELWGQWVKDVGLLQLQGLQLRLDLLEGDTVQTRVFMADGDEMLPEFSVKTGSNRWRLGFLSIFLYASLD